MRVFDPVFDGRKVTKDAEQRLGKTEGKHGIYRCKRKSDPSKYEYLCVISFGYTEEYNEKTGKMRKKENRSQKIFQTLKEAEGYQGLIQKGRGKVQNTERNNSYGKRLLAYFTTKDPRKITTLFEQLQVRMNKVRMKQCKAPLPRRRLHDLLRSNIPALLHDGVSIVSVAANSGHVFPELQRITATRVYWHDDDKREDILDYWNEKLKINIKTPDQDIFKQPNTITNRLNLRSDEH